MTNPLRRLPQIIHRKRDVNAVQPQRFDGRVIHGVHLAGFVGRAEEADEVGLSVDGVIHDNRPKFSAFLLPDQPRNF